MVHCNLLDIQRVIMHRILPRTAQREHVEAECNEQLIVLDNNIKSLVINRLTESFGRQGKSFELTIEQDGIASCFSKVKDLHSLNNQEFIDRSKDIAQLLADAMDARNSIPGGYFLLIEATCQPRNNNVYIVMKAEKHDALSEVGQNVQALNNIFLSPAQKLYKAGIFEQIGTNNVLTKEQFNGYLFDSQFNDGTRLAEYFYKSFLGFSIEGHGDVQTKMFYDLFVDTIDTVYKSNIDSKNNARDLLQAEINNQEMNINAHETINRIIPLNDRDKFISKVVSKFPNAFVKNTSLISKKLEKRSVLLTESVRIFAPSDLFANEDITISLDPDDPSVKIVKVKTHGN